MNNFATPRMTRGGQRCMERMQKLRRPTNTPCVHAMGPAGATHCGVCAAGGQPPA